MQNLDRSTCSPYCWNDANYLPKRAEYRIFFSGIQQTYLTGIAALWQERYIHMCICQSSKTSQLDQTAFLPPAANLLPCHVHMRANSDIRHQREQQTACAQYAPILTTGQNRSAFHL